MNYHNRKGSSGKDPYQARDINSNYSLKLADKLLNSNNVSRSYKNQNKSNNQFIDNAKKIEQILNKMRLLLKNNNKQ